MSDQPADTELHATKNPLKNIYVPREALTLEEWKRLMRNATRNLTDEPIQRRRGSGTTVNTTTDMKDFL